MIEPASPFIGPSPPLIELVEIRPYGPADRGGVRTVCLRTGDAGLDATGLHPHEDLLPDTYALPYVDFSPELALVVEHEEVVAGYVLGVADTRSFVYWLRRERVPALLRKYSGFGASGILYDAVHPERMLRPQIDEYPAHLHIDFLPPLRGRGLGRQLIECECDLLRAAGAVGVHLGASLRNTVALAFYPRVGFTELARDDEAVIFGRRL